MAIHVIYNIKSCDYDKGKQDGRLMKTNCVSSNNCTHGAVSVLQDVIWIDQCSSDLSMADDAVVFRSGMELCICIPR